VPRWLCFALGWAFTRRAAGARAILLWSKIRWPAILGASLTIGASQMNAFAKFTVPAICGTILFHPHEHPKEVRVVYPDQPRATAAYSGSCSPCLGLVYSVGS
jgi:hypothetical protein